MFLCALGLPPVQCTNVLHVSRKEIIKIDHVLYKQEKSGKKSEEKGNQRSKVNHPISQ